LVSGKVHPLSGTERPFRRGGQRQTAYNPR
jgi:hypothetical protein